MEATTATIQAVAHSDGCNRVHILKIHLPPLVDTLPAVGMGEGVVVSIYSTGSAVTCVVVC